MTTTAPVVGHHDVTRFFRTAFARIDCPVDVSEPTIHALVQASLRGTDSHGIRLMPHYIDAARAGRINLSPAMTVRRTSPTTATLDADHTYGTAAATMAMQHTIEMARASGMGCTAIANSSHFGAAAIYGLMAAEAGMMGFCFTHSDALVAPFGGTAPALGTNPICFTCPCEGEQPFCLDMATSATSWNQLRMRRQAGLPLENDWAIDANGAPTTDSALASALLPLGGYKGFGLALMVEILCSLLTGMPSGVHVTPMFPVGSERRRIGHLVAAVDIDRFQPVRTFKARLRALLTELRAQPPASGYERVMVAGDPEKEQHRWRSAHGIPVTATDLGEFSRIAALLRIEDPWLTAREHSPA